MSLASGRIFAWTYLGIDTTKNLFRQWPLLGSRARHAAMAGELDHSLMLPLNENVYYDDMMVRILRCLYSLHSRCRSMIGGIARIVLISMIRHQTTGRTDQTAVHQCNTRESPRYETINYRMPWKSDGRTCAKSKSRGVAMCPCRALPGQGYVHYPWR